MKCYVKDIDMLVHNFKWDEIYTIAVDGVVQCSNCHKHWKPSEARKNEAEVKERDSIFVKKRFTDFENNQLRSRP